MSQVPIELSLSPMREWGEIARSIDPEKKRSFSEFDLTFGFAMDLNGGDRFAKLEENLEELIENIRQTSIIVSDFQPQGQNNLNQKIHSIVHNLQEIDRCKNQFSDVTVPVSVLQYIDQGTNPQLYSKDLMERALEKNEQVKGKIEVYKKFHQCLTDEMAKTFPDVFEFYMKTRNPQNFT